MINQILTKFFGSKNERDIKKVQPLVSAIGALETGIKALSDSDLAAKYAEFRGRHDQGEPLDDLLPETYAVVREVAWRAVDMRHFDVQMIGGIALHRGIIAEMKTGEGKTLVATLPVVLNSLSGLGVHVVTVNDYLARRDSEWMGKIYSFLGMSIGVVQHDLKDAERRSAYGSDVSNLPGSAGASPSRAGASPSRTGASPFRAGASPFRAGASPSRAGTRRMSVDDALTDD